MSTKQHTIKQKVSVTGVGLHTGAKVTLTFNPAPEHHWLKFQRTDVEGQPIIDADADLVVDTSRGTTLEKNGVRVHTTEHVLAALVGLILKIFIQMIIFKKAAKKLNEIDLWALSFFYEIVLLIVYPIFHISKLFNKPNKWKS